MTDYYERMRQLSGSQADWATDDLVLGDGEIAFERDTGSLRMKVGDGASTFTELDYLVDPLWFAVGSDAYNLNTGRITIGDTILKNKLSVIGGDYNLGVYRDSIVTDGDFTGRLRLGAFTEADTPETAVLIRGVAEGDWSTVNQGARMELMVTIEGTTTQVVGLTVNDNQTASIEGDTFQIKTAKTPTSATAGSDGMLAWDDDYLYVYTSNGWAYVALTLLT